MPIFTSIEIEGYRERAVPNTFIRQETETEHLAIVLPGLGYTASMPVLYYPGLALRNLGADLLQVEYGYSDEPSFFQVSQSERQTWMWTEADAALDAGLSQRSYSRITLIGKSLGTIAMSHLLCRHIELPRSHWIWLTPIVKDEQLRRQVEEFKPTSLFVIGTADGHYDGERFDQVVNATLARSVVIEGADHSLEIENDLGGTIDAIKQIVREVREFVES